MEPTATQLANRVNPTPYSYASPSDGVFRQAGDIGAIYKKQGNNIIRLDLLEIGRQQNPNATNAGDFSLAAKNYLRGQGIDYDNLPQVNSGDYWQQQIRSGALGNIPGGDTQAYINAFTKQGTINDFLGQASSNLTNQTGNQFDAQGLAQLGADQLKAINATKTAAASNQPFSITDPNRVVNFTTGQTALSAATPPTSADGINPIGGINMPSTSPTFGNISNASASAAGSNSLIDMLQKQMQDAQAQREALQPQQDSILDQLMGLGNQSTAQMRSDAFAQTGIDPQQYFAEQKAMIAEIGKLTEEFNAVKAAKEAQIAQSYDKLGSNNFINNQIAQIERNAAPKLNQLSANINAKAGVMQALQGNFAEAQNFVNQAVEDAVADKQFKYNVLSDFYQANQNTIDKLDDKYQTAFSQAITLAQQEYEFARQDKQQVGNLLLEYPKAGIQISDSVQTAQTKAANWEARNGGTTLDELYKSLQIQKLQKDLNSPSTGGSSLLSVDEAIKLGVPFGTTEAEATGRTPLTTSQRNLLAAFEPAKILIGQIESLSDKVNTSPGGPQRFLQGASSQFGSLLQINPDAALFEAQKGKLSLLVRALGEKGTLADQDVKRVVKSLPSLYDSKEVADRKLTELKDFISQIESGTINTFTTQPGQRPSLEDIFQ